MVFIDQLDLGGTVSIVAIYSIPLLYAHATIAIRLVATAGVAKMNEICICGEVMEPWYVWNDGKPVWLCRYCDAEDED